MQKTKILACAIAVSLFVLMFTGVLYAEEGVLKVKEKVGVVLVKTPSDKDWVDLNLDQTLKSKDSVKTTEESRVILVLPDNSSVSLKQNTEISIEELIWDNTARKANLNMPAGELRAIIQKVDTPSDFKVRTPVAICGARGTIFYVRVLNGATSVYVSDGSVDFINPVTGAVHTVIAGMMMTISADGSVVGPEEVADVDLAGWTEYYDQGSAEPYGEPMGGSGAGMEINAPEVTEETPASRT